MFETKQKKAKKTTNIYPSVVGSIHNINGTQEHGLKVSSKVYLDQGK